MRQLQHNDIGIQICDNVSSSDKILLPSHAVVTFDLAEVIRESNESLDTFDYFSVPNTAHDSLQIASECFL